MSTIKGSCRTAVSAAFALFTLSATAYAQEAIPQVVVVPEASVTRYSLAAGATSALINVPVNVPVKLVGTQISAGFRGVGEAALLAIPGSGGFIEWAGLDSCCAAVSDTTSPSAGTSGFSGPSIGAPLGTKIVFLDFDHKVQVEAASATQIRVHNLGTSAATGSIMLSW